MRLRRPFALIPSIALPLLAACSGGDGRAVLTVYSPHGREMLSAFEKRFETAHPDIDLQYVDMGSQEVMDRVRSERANPQADIWWGAPSSMFQQAADDSLLAPSSPSWGAALPAGTRDPQGRWYGTYLTPEVIAYNGKAVPAAEAPKDWDDVLDPKWKGKLLIRDPMASGTMRTIFGMVVQRGLRATGDTAAGFTWLRRLDANTKQYVLNPTMLYQMLAREEGLVTLWALPDIEMVREKYKYPIEYVIPSSGTPQIVDAVAIVRGAPNPEAAKVFMEYVGGTAALIPAVRDFYRLPVRADFPMDSMPPRLRAAQAAIKPEPMDWKQLQERESEWMRYWDEHVRDRGGR
ncbi:extracellular solute-binding protein [Longimicrobium terrae]|uniref:Iron(III) transport system substrate-binding protein n=1 Tax=Longimicrobium terrae TaxID=1639882 RepID=A0A841H0R2_9BACT|nr:extracellular solute-binding protein [Longimicrobium terrae]MBB4637277.1 iron(III) transport system substrate-binding protein [Longimicrobium terrae]MBB6071675.1 iron(III) transport system substrate-binding protein [Longimicrobium terrae]NNC28436.1 extracellular solute-binding protein [Longimicrobium terrae]